MGFNLCMWPDLGELVAAIGGSRLRLLGDAGRDRPVRGITLAEALEAVDRAPADSLVLLTRAASAEAATYRFDVAMRRGADRGVVGIALASGVPDVLPRSARAISERSDLGLLAYGEHVDLAELAAAIVAVLAGDAPAALERAAAGIRALDAGRDRASGVEQALAAVLEALPGARLGEPEPGELAESVEVDGVHEAWLVAPEGGPIETLLLRAGAVDVAGAIGRARREQDAPIRTRSELLTELLATEPGRDGALLRRARALGLAVDGWHTVILIAFEQGLLDDPVDLDGRRRVVEQVALGVARAVSGTWHLARSEGRVVLLRTTDSEPGDAGAAAALSAARSVLAALGERSPGSVPSAGIGGGHLGPAGLRGSAAEARAALATARDGEPAVFDATGLRAMLAEWYATDSARRSVAGLLEPLDELGPRRAAEAIHTLQVFLEEQGSVTRTAKRLHLHRNAVSYRVRRIFDALGVERDDPEALLALQLACRARSLA